MLTAAAIAIYYVSSLSKDVENHQLEIIRLNEKLKIHKQIADLKARIIHLEKRSKK